jgi:hypothetical protein
MEDDQWVVSEQIEEIESYIETYNFYQIIPANGTLDKNFPNMVYCGYAFDSNQDSEYRIMVLVCHHSSEPQGMKISFVDSTQDEVNGVLDDLYEIGSLAIDFTIELEPCESYRVLPIGKFLYDNGGH